MSATWNPVGTALIQTDDGKREVVSLGPRSGRVKAEAPQVPPQPPERPR
jgi:hypothetical protein